MQNKMFELDTALRHEIVSLAVFKDDMNGADCTFCSPRHPFPCTHESFPRSTRLSRIFHTLPPPLQSGPLVP